MQKYAVLLPFGKNVVFAEWDLGCCKAQSKLLSYRHYRFVKFCNIVSEKQVTKALIRLSGDMQLKPVFT